MRQVEFPNDLAILLRRYDCIGGVLDFVALEATETGTPEELHRAAALEGMAAIDRGLERWAIEHHSDELPIERFFRVTWDSSVLTGNRASFVEFWGTDDVEPKNPIADGFKTAFLDPPYGLSEPWEQRLKLFQEITSTLLGGDLPGAEIFSWSTNWSNYFDAGHEWWGAFYWTLRSENAAEFVVIAGSTTD